MDLLYILELEPSCMDFTKKGYQQALAAVGGFKDLIRKQRKRLAKKYHPDSNGGDDTLMKEINNAADLLLMIEVKPIQKPQLRPGMVFHFNFNVSSGNNQTTAGSTYYQYDS